MRTFVNILFVLMSVPFFSCTNHKFYTKDEGYNKLKIPLVTDTIIILDKREQISKGDDIFLPFISHSKQLITFYPSLKQDHEDILRQTIVENLVAQGGNISTITIELKEAKKEFYATYTSEKELVRIVITIKAQTNDTTVEVTESKEFYRKSMDAKYKKFEKLYQNALREVTFIALNKLKEKI